MVNPLENLSIDTVGCNVSIDDKGKEQIADLLIRALESTDTMSSLNISLSISNTVGIDEDDLIDDAGSEEYYIVDQLKSYFRDSGVELIIREKDYDKNYTGEELPISLPFWFIIQLFLIQCEVIENRNSLKEKAKEELIVLLHESKKEVPPMNH